MSTPGPLSVVMEGPVTVVVFGPGQRHLDEVGLEAIGNQLIAVAQDANPPLLVLDLTVTEFFGSSFIEILFRVWKRLNSRADGNAPAAKFAICGLQEHCREVMEVTHLDKLWPLYATRAEAVAGIGK
ncbi:MAG: STAS domain-containing protein [Planctomycetes bacterium]|nr:STAS domain-containing protein [Planctomycetota bacterium]